MLLSLEPDGLVPIYQQIWDRIVEAIAGGRQPAGCRPRAIASTIRSLICW